MHLEEDFIQSDLQYIYFLFWISLLFWKGHKPGQRLLNVWTLCDLWVTYLGQRIEEAMTKRVNRDSLKVFISFCHPVLDISLRM